MPESKPLDATRYPLLTTLNLPADIPQLNRSELTRLAAEVRGFLIETIPQIGGHFAAGLGAVELTVALHHAFSSPDDRLVWDVGHQAYPHKILTGRADQLHTIRQLHGLAPFPERAESPHDAFGVGHSSTSISVALGMQMAFERQHQPHHAVAIIGDGGMTAGMAFEALNHAGECKANLLVILNDNEMSISPNVGALSTNLAKAMSGQTLANIREEGKRVLKSMPGPLWDIAKRAEAHVKGMVMPGTLFEEFGFNYYGPIDGHDVEALTETIGNLKQLPGPRLLHITTKKGKGYAPAEAEPVKYHGVGKFSPENGIEPSQPSNQLSYSEIFGQWLIDTAREDQRLMAITPAMSEGSGMVAFAQQFPAQFCDVAIAEQHSVTVAAGMATEGLKPVVAIYSTFLQRAYDQVIHDVALQNLPLMLAIDRAGLVGADGSTHAGSYDLSFLRVLPNIVIMTPSDENELQLMLNTGHQHDGPSAVRYPRGKGNGTVINASTNDTLPIGKSRQLRQGSDIALLAFGSMVDVARQVADELDATVIDMRFVKPLDIDAIRAATAEHSLVVTLEENVIAGGAGSAVNEAILSPANAIKLTGKCINIGLPDKNLGHGSHQELRELAQLDAKGVLAQIRAVLSHQ